jgi:ribonuclease-3
MANPNLESFLAKYDVRLESYDLLTQALTHSSFANEHHTLHNERLEFLGDAVLQLLTSEYIFKTFSNLDEGRMSKLRAAYVCEDANLKYAKEMGIDEFILLGKGEETSGGRDRTAILSDAFEAVLGAIYLSSGLASVKKILSVIVFPKIVSDEVEPFIDYKSRLQECIQAENRSILKYTLDNVEGPAHRRLFTMSVYLDDIKMGTGTGVTKKDATQAAAAQALKTMVKE